MFLDIGVGILMAIVVSKIFALKLSLFFVAAGIVFSLLMDADAIINLIHHRGVSQSHKHRDMFHLPLLYIPIGMLIFYFFFRCFPMPQTSPLALSVLFGLTSLAHFIHDSIGLGWGVKWLFPFSQNQYSFFYQYNARRAGLHLKHGVYIWKSEEIDTLEEKYGDKNWFRNIYLVPHPYSLIEIAVFIASFVTLYFVIKN